MGVRLAVALAGLALIVVQVGPAEAHGPCGCLTPDSGRWERA